MGELTINFLRDKYLERDPTGLKDFHDIILDLSSASADISVHTSIRMSMHMLWMHATNDTLRMRL